MNFLESKKFTVYVRKEHRVLKSLFKSEKKALRYIGKAKAKGFEIACYC